MLESNLEIVIIIRILVGILYSTVSLFFSGREIKDQIQYGLRGSRHINAIATNSLFAFVLFVSSAYTYFIGESTHHFLSMLGFIVILIVGLIACKKGELDSKLQG